MRTSTATDWTRLEAELASLPELPTVHAQNMYAAQGWKPSADERAAITSRVEFNRRWLPNPDVTIWVKDRSGATIGGLTFKH